MAGCCQFWDNLCWSLDRSLFIALKGGNIGLTLVGTQSFKTWKSTALTVADCRPFFWTICSRSHWTVNYTGTQSFENTVKKITPLLYIFYSAVVVKVNQKYSRKANKYFFKKIARKALHSSADGFSFFFLEIWEFF